MILDMNDQTRMTLNYSLVIFGEKDIYNNGKVHFQFRF